MHVVGNENLVESITVGNGGQFRSSHQNYLVNGIQNQVGMGQDTGGGGGVGAAAGAGAQVGEVSGTSGKVASAKIKFGAPLFGSAGVKIKID